MSNQTQRLRCSLTTAFSLTYAKLKEDGLPDINQPLGLAPVAFWFQVSSHSAVRELWAGSLLPFALDPGLGPHVSPYFGLVGEPERPQHLPAKARRSDMGLVWLSGASDPCCS